MQINSLLENIATISSSPDNTTSSAPKFGRSDKFLEDDKVDESSCGTSTAGGIASVPSSMGGMQRRSKGSMFTGIKTSSKFPNSIAVKEDNEEYDDEAGMVDNNLETMKRAVQGIDDVVSSGDNLPEWCQEKIAVAKSMLVTVWDYMRSEEERDVVDEELKMKHQRDTYGPTSALGRPDNRLPDNSNSLADRDFQMSTVPNVTKSVDGHPTVKYRHHGHAGYTRVEPTLNPTSVGRLVKTTIPNSLKKKEVEEAGMPSSVVKNKQRYASMSDSDFAKAHKEKSDDELKAMAWRHGYGKGSSHYVNKRNKGQQGVAEDTRERLSNKHDKIRKQAGLPDPKEYEKLIQQKKKEIADLKAQQNKNMNEAEISEEQLLAKELRKQLDMFKNAPNKDISGKAPSKDISTKPKDKDIINKVLDEKSVSKAQFRTMAAVAHNPKFAKKVGIKPSVGKEFHKADKKQDYKELPSRADEESKGLWANIHAKRERIKNGSGEHMRKPGSKGAPTASALRKSAK